MQFKSIFCAIIILFLSVTNIYSNPPKVITYPEIHAQALRENKPLIIWLNTYKDNVELIDSFPNCLHYFCNDFEFKKFDPAVIIGMPDGQGNIYRHDLKENEISFENINKIINPVRYIIRPTYNFNPVQNFQFQQFYGQSFGGFNGFGGNGFGGNGFGGAAGSC